MKRILDDAELEKVSAHIAAQMGLHFPPSKWLNLEQAFRTAARELGFSNMRECVAWFMATPPSKAFIESMACYLTIGETYFLREAQYFEIFEQQILPEIISKRQGNEQRLRLWSAGCATGEEPYSIAILLHKMRDRLRDWAVSILATDINPHALRKARQGVYTNWSFRNTPAGFREHYFRKTGDGRFELLPEIKGMVRFYCFNLVEDCYPSLVTDTNAIDVIFCRNVLMYLTPQLAAKVVERLHRCLLNDGWLFVSPCEAPQFISSCFAVVNYPDAILYRKQGAVLDRATNGKGERETNGGGETEKGRNREDKNGLTPSPVPRFSGSKGLPPPPLPVSPVQEVSAYQEALTLYLRGAYEKAAEMVALQLARNRNDTPALTLLCRIHANEGRLAEALNASDQALATDRLSAGLHYLRAVILQEQGREDEAIASLKKSLYIDHDLVLAHFTLANLEQHKGRHKESQRHYTNALSLLDTYHPDDVIPESDGMLAGRLKEIIRATTTRM